jgi:hypothetical protein
VAASGSLSPSTKTGRRKVQDWMSSPLYLGVRNDDRIALKCGRISVHRTTPMTRLTSSARRRGKFAVSTVQSDPIVRRVATFRTRMHHSRQPSSAGKPPGPSVWTSALRTIQTAGTKAAPAVPSKCRDRVTRQQSPTWKSLNRGHRELPTRRLDDCAVKHGVIVGSGNASTLQRLPGGGPDFFAVTPRRVGEPEYRGEGAGNSHWPQLNKLNQVCRQRG